MIVVPYAESQNHLVDWAARVFWGIPIEMQHLQMWWNASRLGPYLQKISVFNEGNAASRGFMKPFHWSYEWDDETWLKRERFLNEILRDVRSHP